jgi:signal transduction histidine kinase
MAVDVVLAALIGVASFADVASSNDLAGRETEVAEYLLSAAGAFALIWRRIAPLTVLVAVTAVISTYWLLGYTAFQSLLGLFAFYSAAAHGVNRRRTWLTVAACIPVLIVVAAVSILDEPDGFDWANAVNITVYLTGAAAVGAVVRNRKRIFVDMEDRADRAETERQTVAQRAVARERNRIAREMHDVVAHGMSVITVQAGAAKEIVHADPDAAEQSLAEIEAVGRESLNEMRRMLGVLRSGDDDTSSFEPTPRLDDVLALVSHCNEAGVPTTLQVTGTQRELPAGVGLAVYRVVQEALTNVLKHAGTPARADVRLDFGETSLEIEVTDDGRDAGNSAPATAGGQGLIGMSERVEAYGGELTTQPRTGGGYRVRAVLPIEAVARPTATTADTQPTGSIS